MAKSERLELGDNYIYRQYKSIFNHCDVIGQKATDIGEKKPQNKGYYAIQGHRGRYHSKARMRLPISD